MSTIITKKVNTKLKGEKYFPIEYIIRIPIFSCIRYKKYDDSPIFVSPFFSKIFNLSGKYIKQKNNKNIIRYTILTGKWIPEYNIYIKNMERYNLTNNEVLLSHCLFLNNK